MPEGDTVWLAARRLHQTLQGRILTSTDFRVPALATVDLTGFTVVEVVPRGKHILMRTSQGSRTMTIRSHLRMDGTWHVYRNDEVWRGGPRHWIRAVLSTADTDVVGYRLAMLAVVPTEKESTLVGHLGPDILDPNLDVPALVERVRAEGERPLGEALLDQRVVAGLGTNLIAEICFVLGIHPATPVTRIDTRAVITKAREVTRANAPRASRVTTGDPLRPAWVYGRRTCMRCGSKVHRLPVGSGPTQRTLAFCSACQPPPTVE